MFKHLVHGSIVGLLAIAATVACRAAEPREPPSPRPNVLLICVDDLKPVLGCYGDPVARTPNIDQLAARGVAFDAAYCNQAVCSPSRNALLTSLRPQTLGIYDLPTNFRKSAPNAITLGQHLRQNGYHAESLGKVFHVGHGNHDDVVSWDEPHFRPGASVYANPQDGSKKRTGAAKQNGPVTENADVLDETYVDGLVAAEAVKCLERASQDRSRPFFMAVGFIRPHLPFVAPKKYWDLYDPAELPMPKFTSTPVGSPQYAPTNFGELRSYSGVPNSGEIDEALTRNLIHGYYAATSYTDAQIGKVLDALTALKLDKNTIVVLWGDHGWHLGDHGMWCKHTNYEQAARIPVIFAGPSIAAGQHTRAMIESVDIYPTLSQLAGLQSPPGLDGRSFSNVLESPEKPARESVIHVYPRDKRLGRAIRTERYRLVEWKTFGESSDEAEWELFDYKDDPLETKNLASERSEVVAELRQILSQHPAPKPPVNAGGAGKPAGAPKDRTAMFNRRDKNGDHQLTYEEFMQSQPDPEAAKGRFTKFDRDGDKLLTLKEFIGK